MSLSHCHSDLSLCSMESHFQDDEEIGLRQLVSTQAKLQSMMERASTMASGLDRMENRLNKLNGGVSATAMALAPLQSAAMVAKALDSRIDRAITPALRVLEKFGKVQQLQITIADILQQQQQQNQGAGIYSASRVDQVQELVVTIENLELSVGLLKDECEPAIQRLQEAVEFLCRTKATDYYRAHRLSETLSTLKALYENEVEDLNDGMLIEKALSRLEFEFTRMLQHAGRMILKKELQQGGISIRDNDEVGCLDLASKQEIHVLRRIVEVMHGYGRIDECIDIYAQVRWRRAAKALIRLKLDYLLNFKNIDDVEWEALESSISLWIEHFKISVSVVLASEKELCRQIFGDKDLVLLSACVGRVGRKVMAAFLRFGDGFARSKKEHQKLFKLLEMFESMEGLKPQFYEIFEGDGGREICLEFRELQKQVVSAACKVFWEFGMLVEGQRDGAVPPADGSVPKLVKYAVAYMESLAGEYYAPLMTKVLKIEHLWKFQTLPSVEGSPEGPQESPKGPLPLGKWLTGKHFQPEQNQNQNPFCEAVSNFMEALQRNLDSKASAYKDRSLGNLFTMNAQWYIYTRTKNTELGKLVDLAHNHKQAAERAGYLYLKEAWGHVTDHLNTEDLNGHKPNIRSIVKQRLKSFMTAFEETCQRHQLYYCVPDKNLSEQIITSVSQAIVPAYANFLDWLQQGRETASLSYENFAMVSPDSIQKALGDLFGGETGKRKAINVMKRSASVSERYNDQNYFLSLSSASRHQSRQSRSRKM